MNRTRGALALLLLAGITGLVVEAIGRANAAGAADAGRSWAVSTDPEAVVIRLKISGGMELGSGAVYTLTGDGGLVHEPSHPRARRESFELSPLEVDDLLRIAVEGGLIGLEWPTLEARLQKLARAATQLTDAAHFELQISLERFRDGGGKERGPVVSTFACFCSPAYLAYKFGDVPEVAALDSLAKGIQERFHKREAKE